METFCYYTDFFHDGALLAIIMTSEEIIFEMESVQIYTCDNRDQLSLSVDNTIYGRLHAEGIRSIKSYNVDVENLKIECEYGKFLHCEFKGTLIYLTGTWQCFGGKEPSGNPVFDFEVIAKKVFWENTANTTDPSLLGKYMGLEGPPPYDYPQWYIDKYGPQDDDEEDEDEEDPKNKTVYECPKTLKKSKPKI